MSNGYLKKTIIFQGFRGGGGGQHLPGGGPTFSRGGVQISIETHITCDIPGGPGPLSPSGSAHATRNTQS